MRVLPLFGLSLAVSLSVLVACSTDDDEPVGPACAPSRLAPYAEGSPYLGIHADPGNSDVVDCETQDAYSSGWHALKGLGVMQPNTFSPDGKVTYATSTNPQEDGCRLHAVDVESGAVLWCRSYPPSIARSAVEVDAEGHLYFTVEASVVSTLADGQERWRVDFTTDDGTADAPWGVHFTPDQHVATVTTSGVVYLVDRADGRVVADLSISAAFGFPLASRAPRLDTTVLLPEEVQANIRTVWGEGSGPGFASFLGTDGFVDNTLGVSSRGRIYVMVGGIDGGEDGEVGALVQIHDEDGTLRPGWSMQTHRGSATSPSISPGDRYVMVSDGASAENLLNADGVDARVKVADIDACDANTDADPEPGRCAVAYEERLQRGAVPGSPAIDRDGTVVFYEFGLDFAAEPTDRDLVAFGPDGILWEAALPDALDWTSVITVTRNHLIGTATRVTPSDRALGAVTFPRVSEDRLVVLDRKGGALVFSAPVPDDSAATVTIGPEGELYVGMLGLVSVLSTAESPTLGLMRFSPLP